MGRALVMHAKHYRSSGNYYSLVRLGRNLDFSHSTIPTVGRYEKYGVFGTRFLPQINQTGNCSITEYLLVIFPCLILFVLIIFLFTIKRPPLFQLLSSIFATRLEVGSHPAVMICCKLFSSYEVWDRCSSRGKVHRSKCYFSPFGKMLLSMHTEKPRRVVLLL